MIVLIDGLNFSTYHSAPRIGLAGVDQKPGGPVAVQGEQGGGGSKRNFFPCFLGVTGIVPAGVGCIYM